MGFYKPLHLLLGVQNRVFEQLSVGLVAKLNQGAPCDAIIRKRSAWQAHALGIQGRIGPAGREPLPGVNMLPLVLSGFMAAKVTIVNNGPIRIEGEFTIEDSEGNSYGLSGRTVISLCRCGMADNKPFCDGTHGRNGFNSQCKARELPPPKPKI
jgi:CDGSH-type Zn-finger protein